MQQNDPDSSAHMTAEELDALIAEQMRPENLPAWWHEDVEDARIGVRIGVHAKPKQTGRPKRKTQGAR